MHRTIYCFVLTFATFWGVTPNRVAAQETFKMDSIVLLNSIPEFEQRAPSAKTISEFINKMKTHANVVIGSELSKDKTPRNGIIVVAIRPDQTIKYWVDVEDKSKPTLGKNLTKAMSKVGVPAVNGGPVAFVLQFHIWGGRKVDQAKVKMPPLPIQWRQAGNKQKAGSLKVPDDMLDLVWPKQDMASLQLMTEDSEDEPKRFVPDGFVLQALDPIGGSVPRPKDWHFAKNHRRNTLDWTISKEDPKGGYITGVRIQFFVGIEKLTKQTPQQFVKKFLDSTRESSKVLGKREPVKFGAFTRVGLETEKPRKNESVPFRILYSCFWANDLDMAAITISGTTSDLWKESESTFDAMSHITLIDMDRMQASMDRMKRKRNMSIRRRRSYLIARIRCRNEKPLPRRIGQSSQDLN